MSQKKQYPNFQNTILQQLEKTDLLILLEQELHIPVNGLEASEMDMACKCGKIMQDMKGNGKTIEPMAMVNLYMLMEIFMKEIGLMTKLTDMVFIYI